MTNLIHPNFLIRFFLLIRAKAADINAFFIIFLEAAQGRPGTGTGAEQHVGGENKAGGV
jgi:hypothetical protein